MTCCTSSGAISAGVAKSTPAAPSADEILLSSRPVGETLREAVLSIPAIHCGGCIQKIERALMALQGVEHARVNLTTKRVAVRWRAGRALPPFIEALERLGYPAHPCDETDGQVDGALTELVRALAVAAFATGNIMLLSVSVWSGSDPGTRDVFHWLSAAIALPALCYSGRVFFRSAWGALRHGQTNMDVPITIGVLLAFAISAYDTAHGGPHAYFDASVMLLLFLLVGRTLDHVMRERARTAVRGLARLGSRGALAIRSDGSHEYVPVADITPGTRLLVAAGERIPVDGYVEAGTSDLDCSLVSGESASRPVATGSVLQSGTLNLTGPLTIRATAAAADSFLAEMVRLMEAAEGARSKYRRIADRAAAAYAPAVHLAAFLAFAGWIAAVGDVHQAITIAVAVLIITCPCALGLAVPMVQALASRKLFEASVMVKDGAAVERLAEVDTVVFDKTGTLTHGRPRLRDPDSVGSANLELGAAIAVHSGHPHSTALVEAAGPRAVSTSFASVTEYPGCGLEARSSAGTYRLGRAEWALESRDAAVAGPGTVLSWNGRLLTAFAFDDRLRPGALEAVAALRRAGLDVHILSGDKVEVVERLSSELGIAEFAAGVLPSEKVAAVEALTRAGRKVLMVGDGLNDAPALAAAHASMAPGSAADVGRNAADFVFLDEDLGAVPRAIATSVLAARLMRQNLILAIVYNAIALPLAVLGFVTPLLAALAMSSSSVLVVANALRVTGAGRRRRRLAIPEPSLGRSVLLTEQLR